MRPATARIPDPSAFREEEPDCIPMVRHGAALDQSAPVELLILITDHVEPPGGVQHATKVRSSAFESKSLSFVSVRRIELHESRSAESLRSRSSRRSRSHLTTGRPPAAKGTCVQRPRADWVDQDAFPTQNRVHWLVPPWNSNTIVKTTPVSAAASTATTSTAPLVGTMGLSTGVARSGVDRAQAGSQSATSTAPARSASIKTPPPQPTPTGSYSPYSSYPA